MFVLRCLRTYRVLFGVVADGVRILNLEGWCAQPAVHLSESLLGSTGTVANRPSPRLHLLALLVLVGSSTLRRLSEWMRTCLAGFRRNCTVVVISVMLIEVVGMLGLLKSDCVLCFLAGRCLFLFFVYITRNWTSVFLPKITVFAVSLYRHIVWNCEILKVACVWVLT